MNSTAPNPYRGNAEILRGFFRRPVTLITGIAFFLSFSAGILCSAFGSEYNFVTLDILFAVAFCLLFSEARFKSQNPTFKFQAALLKVISVISCCVCIAAIAALILLALIFSQQAVSSGDLLLVLTLLAVCALMCVVPMIFYINVSRMASSFRKSVNSIYLYRKGAVGTGIFGILCALLIPLSVVALPVASFLVEIISPLFESLYDILNSTVAIGFQFNPSELSLAQALAELSYFDYAAVIFSFISAVSISIFSFKYNGYIKKISERLTPSVQAKDEEPAAEPAKRTDYTQNPYNQSAPSQPAPLKPQEFVPRQVFKADDKKICPTCGHEADGNLPFCANCGTKL